MELPNNHEPYQPVEKLCVLAPGLIGASVAQACRKNRTAKSIAIWSRRASSRAKLTAQPWCDEICDDPAKAAADADIVVICSPVDFIVPLYNEIRESLKPGAIVTDVGSTKSLVCRQARAIEGNKSHFVGSHPMAGSEKTGMDYASDDLFENRPCIVTPLEETDDLSVQRIIMFWKSLGALTFVKTPEDHDEIVAHISHLPHLLASGLCHFLSHKPADWKALASSGLQDTTRIASGDPGIWKSIVETNRDEILRALSAYQDELYHIQSALTNNNMIELVSILEKGKKFRDHLS
jgi:cyclohexadieny/prephenate dehydrogenase